MDVIQKQTGYKISADEKYKEMIYFCKEKVTFAVIPRNYLCFFNVGEILTEALKNKCTSVYVLKENDKENKMSEIHLKEIISVRVFMDLIRDEQIVIGGYSVYLEKMQECDMD